MDGAMGTSILGNNVYVFIGLVVLLHGAAGLITGHALAKTWRPWWQAVGYAILLAMSARFFDFALFDGALLSGPAYVVAFCVIAGLALIAYRITWVDKLARQYPWAYRKAAHGLSTAPAHTRSDPG